MLSRTYVYKLERNGFQSREFRTVEACRLCAELACKTFYDVVTVFILDYDDNKVYPHKRYNPRQTEWEFNRDFSDEEESQDKIEDQTEINEENDDYNDDDVENEYEDEGYEEEVTSMQQLIAFGLEKCQQLFHLPEKESSFD